MEEQRQRQEDEARRSGNPPGPEPVAASAMGVAPSSNEDAMLERALAMSMDQPSSNTAAPSAVPAAPVYPNFETMTEEEQIAYAMQMSMQEARKSCFYYYSWLFYYCIPFLIRGASQNGN